MANKITQKLLRVVTDFYLSSHDFNGITIAILQTKIGQPLQIIQNNLVELINEELLGVIDENTDVNPHIIRCGFEPADTQNSKLKKEMLTHLCVYPRPKYLERVVDKSKYEQQPYTLCLALGEPQLSYRSFDLSILENYRNDPRYNYSSNDIHGKISYSSNDLANKDKVFLQTFGFSYNNNFDRAVAVFLRYLSDLSPDHQKIWQAKELPGNYSLHPAYYENAILGRWSEGVPLCSALLKEINIINEMALAMGRPALFKEDFGEYGEHRPKKFGFLIRPTLEEFNNFCHLFDKLLSENIDKEFFQNEVPYETEEYIDGRIKPRSKGTLQILDDWMRTSFKVSDWHPWDETMNALRKVRKLRQSPAHELNEDIFDQKYFKEQRELIIEVYKGIRTMRLMFANHPKVKAANITVPVWLLEGRIWWQ